MENIIKEIESRYLPYKPFSFYLNLNDLCTNDFNNPEFLKNLCWSSYFSYLIDDVVLRDQILNRFTILKFDGNYDKWTWIENAIVLKMKIYLDEDKIDEYKKLKEIIYSPFEFIEIPENTRKISLKAFTRRISGSSIDVVINKVKDATDNKDIELEFMGLIVLYSKLLFIYCMNQGDVSDDLKSEITKTHKRLLDIIEYYRNQ